MKTVVITGSNRGIGLELTKVFLQNGYTVYSICRSPSPQLEETTSNIISKIDVTSKGDLEKLSDRLENVSIDILINNAGIMIPQDLASFSQEGALKQFMANSVAPVLVAQTLLDNFSDKAKIAIITSRMGSIADNTSGGSYGYRMSKSAVNAAGKSLAHDLKDRSISVGIIHPGYVKTDMTNGNGLLTAKESSLGIYERINQLNLDNTGSFWHSNGDTLPW